MTKKEGRVINLNGGIYQVLLKDNTMISVKARGKLRSVKTIGVNPKSLSKKETVMIQKKSPKVGDMVVVDEEFILEILPRKNELIRPDIANVDQIVLVFAAKEPTFSFYLLDLFLVNLQKEEIMPLIVLTKIDLLTDAELCDLKSKLSYYQELGYQVLYVSSKLHQGISLLEEQLATKVSVFSGQTGAGKSSLINCLIPGFKLHTQEISQALGRGKHTTRQTTLYPFQQGFIGDTPGFSKLNVLNVDKTELKDLFLEFKPYECRFKNCLHQMNANGCGVRMAYENHTILASRYENYLKMLEQTEKK